jgi:hypothetical protein
MSALADLNERYLSGLLPFMQEDFERTARESKYFNNPTLWAKDKLGVDLWYKQTEIADDLATGPKKSIAVRAGHGVGKSFLSAVLVCWWIDTRPLQYTFVATTAPSFDQVSAILWREIKGMWSLSHKRHTEYLRLKKMGHDTGDLPERPLPGYVTTQNMWRDDLGNLIAQGRKPPDHNEDAFQGIHAQYVLAIGDEACGLKTNMIDSLANITSNAKSRRLLIANPTNPRSRFGEIFLDTTTHVVEIKGQKVEGTLQDAWSLHHISVLDSPNFHGGDRCTPTSCPERYQEHQLLPHGLGLTMQALEALTDESYVTEKKLEYGESSARYKARVHGEFAYDAGNNLFSEWTLAQGRDATVWINWESTVKTVLGVDVARSEEAGADSTFVYKFTEGLVYDWIETVDEAGTATLELGPVGDREGGQLRLVDTFKGLPFTDRKEADGSITVGQATLIDQHARALRATELRIDSGGLGIGLIDGLYTLYQDSPTPMPYRIVRMQGGGPTPDSTEWINNRAFQFWQMSDRMGKGLIDVDPRDRLLIEQLGDILGEFVDPHGALKIESKDSMKKKGMKSPDAADAAWYACADLSHMDGPQPGDVVAKRPADLLLEMEKRLISTGFRDGYRW